MSTRIYLSIILVNHFQITLESGSEYLQTRGTVTITLIGTLRTVMVTFDKYVYSYCIC